jgi:hypothetical protein
VIESQELVERGAFATLIAPECGPADREGRLEQAERALAAFAPVFRPLTLEIERCWREIDIGLPSRTAFPEPAFCILTTSFPLARATARPTIASPPPFCIVPKLDRTAIAACLETDAPPEPNLLLDWRSIQTIAAAVHTFRPLEGIKLRPSGQTVEASDPGWFAGPPGTTGFDVWPPAELILRAEDWVVLTLNVYWSGWRFGTPESAAFKAGVAELESSGWRRTDGA